VVTPFFEEEQRHIAEGEVFFYRNVQFKVVEVGLFVGEIAEIDGFSVIRLLGGWWMIRPFIQRLVQCPISKRYI
jgi:hypothetical protein